MVSAAAQPAAAQPAPEISSGDKSTELNERLQTVRKVCWIDYPVATTAIDRLTWLLDAPETHRPPCCLIHSDTNNGKTTICLKFARDQNGKKQGDAANQSLTPVLMVQAPAYPDVSALYDAILRKLNTPWLATARTERKHDQVLRLLPGVGVRMIIIDEIHHLLAGKVDQRSIFLNSVKALSNELQIPIAAAGTQEALRAFQTDQQLGNRFEALHLPRWTVDKDYAVFLASLYGNMGLQKESNFRSRHLVTQFHTMAGGLTGETTKLMSLAAEAAIKSGKEMIDLALLSEVRWTAPEDRRRGGRLV